MAFLAHLGDALALPEEEERAASKPKRPRIKYVRGAGPDGFWTPPRKTTLRFAAHGSQSAREPRESQKLAPLEGSPRKLGPSLRKNPAVSPRKYPVFQTEFTPAASSSRTFPLARLFPSPPQDFDPDLSGPFVATEPLPAEILCTMAPRPITRGTLTLAKLNESDLQGGRQIWRGQELLPEMQEFRQDKLEFAQYLSETHREAGRIARERAKHWRAEKLARMRELRKVEEQRGQQACGHGQLVEPRGSRFTIDVPASPDQLRHYQTAEEASSSTQAASAYEPVRSAVHTPEGPSEQPNIDEKASQDNSSRKTLTRSKTLRRKSLNVDGPVQFGAAKSLKQKLRGRRPSQVAAQHKRDFEKLSESEKHALTESFLRHDVKHGCIDAGMGCLNATDVMHALRDFGIRGRTNGDREDIRSLVVDLTTSLGGVDLLNFSVGIVPQVRKKLSEALRARLAGMLQEVMGEVHDDTQLTEDACKDWMEEVLGNALMGSEALTELRECYQLASQALADARQAEIAELPAHQRDTGTFDSDYFDKLFECKTQKGPVMVSFADFVLIVQATQERYERLHLSQLNEIKAQFPLCVAKAGELETDVLPLHSSFRRFDIDRSGTLDQAELNYMLQEFGFLCGEEEYDQVMKNIVKDAACQSDGSLTFAELLQVIYDVRLTAKEHRSEETQAQFQRFDTDHSGQLTVQEVATLFQEMGLAPKCRQGQDEIKRLLTNCDEDQSGGLDLAEFQHLVQLVSEKLRSITRFQEMELGLSLNFSGQQIREYRDCFWHIDKDGSGELDMQELRSLMHMMQQRIDGDDLRLLMNKIDNNSDGVVDFSEFLKLVHAIEQLQLQESEGDEQPMGATRSSANDFARKFAQA